MSGDLDNTRHSEQGLGPQVSVQSKDWDHRFQFRPRIGTTSFSPEQGLGPQVSVQSKDWDHRFQSRARIGTTGFSPDQGLGPQVSVQTKDWNYVIQSRLSEHWDQNPKKSGSEHHGLHSTINGIYYCGKIIDL